MDKFPVIVFFYIISCLNNYVIHFQRTELRKYLKKTHKDKVCSEKVSSYRPEKNLLERGKLNRRLLTTRRDTQMSWKSAPWVCLSWCRRLPGMSVKLWSRNCPNSQTPWTKLPAAWRVKACCAAQQNGAQIQGCRRSWALSGQADWTTITSVTYK